MQLTHEHEQIRDTLKRYIAEHINPHVDEWEEAEIFPAHQVFKGLGDLGLLGLTKPVEYGGMGLDYSYSMVMAETLGLINCGGVPMAIGVQTDMCTPALARFGSDELKRQYLAPAIAGDMVGCIGVSEPGAGSDVSGIKSTARKDGDDYVITGQKRWITNGGVAGWYTVLATFDRGLKHKGIAAFIVDAKSPGVKVGRKEKKMGQRASNTCDVIFEDVRVPARNLLGTEDGGFKVAMKTFDRSRPWIAAGAAGVIRRALDECRTYALERKTFGVPIAQHQAIQFILAEMAIAYETTRLLTHKAAWLVDQGDLSSIVSSYAKAYGADAAMRVTTDAVQVFGGYGYTKEYPVEKLMRDAKLLQIYEGTSQIQRMVIAKNLLGRG